MGALANVEKIEKSHERPSRLDETLTFVNGHFASTKCSLLHFSSDKNSKSWHFAREGGQSAQRIKFDYFSDFPGVAILLEREGGFCRLAWKGMKNMAPPGGIKFLRIAIFLQREDQNWKTERLATHVSTSEFFGFGGSGVQNKQ